LEYTEGSPGVHRRVDVREVPFVGRNLAIGIHIPFTSQQIQLLLRKGGINNGERDAMESSVPCSKERVFPSEAWSGRGADRQGGDSLVWHRQDILYVHVFPFLIGGHSAAELTHSREDTRTLFLIHFRFGGGGGCAG